MRNELLRLVESSYNENSWINILKPLHAENDPTKRLNPEHVFGLKQVLILEDVYRNKTQTFENIVTKFSILTFYITMGSIRSTMIKKSIKKLLMIRVNGHSTPLILT